MSSCFLVVIISSSLEAMCWPRCTSCERCVNRTCVSGGCPAGASCCDGRLCYMPSKCESCAGDHVVTCGDSIYHKCCGGKCRDIRTQGCCDGKTIYNLETQKCCNYGNGKVCDDNQCCEDGECKQCCRNATTGDCEAHNSDCGCDPLGLEDCTDSVKEWTVGQTRYCWSDCNGLPCYKDVVDVPCYARQACVSIADHYDSICIIDCQGTYVGFCQSCGPVGVTTVVRELDCQCD